MFFLILILAVAFGIVLYRYYFRRNDLAFYKGEAKTPEELKSILKNLAERLKEAGKRGVPLPSARMRRELHRERKRINYPLFKSALNKIPKASRLPVSGGFPRVYLLAREIVKGTRAAFTENELRELLAEFQQTAPLYYSEIAALNKMLAYSLCEFTLSSLRFGTGTEAYIGSENAARTLEMLSSADLLSAASFYTVLEREACGVFLAMRRESKEYYLAEIARLSERYNVTEAEISAALIALADKNGTHIGEFLFEKRAETLFAATGRRFGKASEKTRQRIYVLFVLFLGSAVSLAAAAFFSGSNVFRLIAGQLTFFLSFNAAKVVINAVLSAAAAKRVVPLMDIKEIESSDAAAIITVKTVRTREDIYEGFAAVGKIKEKVPQKNTACGIVFLIQRGSDESSAVDLARGIFGGGETAAEFCFAERDSEAHGSALMENICGFFLKGNAEKFLFAEQNMSINPKYLITLDEGDVPEDGAVLSLIAAAKHPQNKSCNIFALTEKTDFAHARRTAYGKLFSDSRGVFSDTDAADTVYGNVFFAGVLSSAKTLGAALLRIEELYNVYRTSMPKKAHANFTLISALAGTARMVGAGVMREKPASFGEHCRISQNYMFGSFQHFPYIYSPPRGRDGAKKRLPPLYGFIIFDGINQSFVNTGSFLLLLIAALTGSALPAAIAAAGYLLVPVLNIIYSFAAVLRGKGGFFRSVIKGFLRALYAFSVLPANFVLGLFAFLRAIIPSKTRSREYSESIIFFPNLIAAAVFFMSGGILGFACAALWLAAVLTYPFMSRAGKPEEVNAENLSYTRRLKKRAKGAEFALINSLESPDESFLNEIEKIKKRISAKKHLLLSPCRTINTIGETPEYHYMCSGGYSVVLDEAGAGISAYKGKFINKHGAIPSECGTFVEVDGERLLPSRTVFGGGCAVFECRKATHETTVKTALLPSGTGEVRQITIQNNSGAEQVFSVKVSTRYAFSELGYLTCQTLPQEIPAPEMLKGGARFITGEICAAEFLRGAEADVSWENGVLSLSAQLKIEAGKSGEICFLRLAADDEDLLDGAVKRAETYGFCGGAIRNAAAYEAFSGTGADTAELCGALLNKLMFSALAAARKDASRAFTGALSVLNESCSARYGFLVLVNLDSEGTEKAARALTELHKTGFKFAAVFLSSAAPRLGAPPEFFWLSEVSEDARKILLSCADFVLEKTSGTGKNRTALKAEYNTQNRQTLSRAKSPVLARPEKNIFVSGSLAAVAGNQNSTLMRGGVFTKNEILYIADRDECRFYTATREPLCAADTEYFVTHRGNESRYTAENKSEKSDFFVSMSAGGAKLYELEVTDKSGKGRRMSAVLYFEIEGIRRFTLQKTEEGAEITGQGNTLCLSFPKGSEYTFSHEEFFGRLNGRENPRGILAELTGAEGENRCLAVKINFELKPKEKKALRLSLSVKGGAETEPANECEVEAVRIFTGNALLDAAGGAEALRSFSRAQKLFSLGFKQSGESLALHNLAMLFSAPASVKNNIFSLCKMQLLRGDFKSAAIYSLEGAQLTHAENALVLPLITAEYVDATGDADILNTVIGYCARGERDSGTDEQVYYHCLRALRFYKIGEDGLVLTRGGAGGAEESVLYFAAVKKFLKFVTSRTLRMLLVENMEKIRESLTSLYYNAKEDEVKMCAYLAGVFNYFDRPVMKARMEEYIDLRITERAEKKEFSPLLYKLIINRVLGIGLCGDKISLRPALMKNLPSARASVKAGSCEYDITVRRTGEKKIIMNGISYTNLEYIPLKAGEKKEIIAEI